MEVGRINHGGPSQNTDMRRFDPTVMSLAIHGGCRDEIIRLRKVIADALAALLNHNCDDYMYASTHEGIAILIRDLEAALLPSPEQHEGDADA